MESQLNTKNVVNSKLTTFFNNKNHNHMIMVFIIYPHKQPFDSHPD